MMFSVPTEEYKANPVIVRALDRILILHADHEQNASTSTVRLAGSSGANPFACISAGISCLWGPAHGGANEACLHMLEEIGDVSRIDEFIKRAKNKDDNYRLMGFGHRVYKNFDPRAKLMRETCHEGLMNWDCKMIACLNWLCNLRRSHWKMTISFPASFTRMLISIPVLCNVHWVYRPACLPLFSRWQEQWDGWHSGMKWFPIQPIK